MSNSASASTSTNPPSLSPSIPPSTTNNASSTSHHPSTSASPTLPHSPETARQIAEARAALEASMQNIGSSLDHTLKSRAQNLHSNSAALEKQQTNLIKETNKMRKETDKLKRVADEGARKVKELGNVQNWAEMLERDFLVLGETMKLVREGDRESGWRGGDEGWETESGSESFSGTESGDEAGERMDEGDTTQRSADKEGYRMNLGMEDPTVPAVKKQESTVDDEGDTAMDGVDEHNDKTKGKEAEVLQQVDAVEGSFMTATTSTGSASTSDPSTSSVHTATSTTS